MVPRRIGGYGGVGASRGDLGAGKQKDGREVRKNWFVSMLL
jgi:hypothetical protein